MSSIEGIKVVAGTLEHAIDVVSECAGQDGSYSEKQRLRDISDLLACALGMVIDMTGVPTSEQGKNMQLTNEFSSEGFEERLRHDFPAAYESDSPLALPIE